MGELVLVPGQRPRFKVAPLLQTTEHECRNGGLSQAQLLQDVILSVYLNLTGTQYWHSKVSFEPFEMFILSLLQSKENGNYAIGYGRTRDVHAQLPLWMMKLQLRFAPSHVMQFSFGIWQNCFRMDTLQSCASCDKAFLKSPSVWLPCKSQNFIWVIRKIRIMFGVWGGVFCDLDCLASVANQHNKKGL